MSVGPAKPPEIADGVDERDRRGRRGASEEGGGMAQKTLMIAR